MKNKLALIAATWFWTGLISPIFLGGMVGTYGSLFSIPLCYMAVEKGWVFHLASVLIVFVIGLWSIPKAEKILGPRTDWKRKVKDHDQNEIVIDEVFGMLVACCPLLFVEVRHIWLALLLAFAFFRFFDITKIPPARFFDRMGNALGVMLDDGVAGIYAAVALLTWIWLFGL